MALTVQWLKDRLEEFPPDMTIKAVYREWSEREQDPVEDGSVLDVGTIMTQPTYGETVCAINVGLPE